MLEFVTIISLIFFDEPYVFQNTGKSVYNFKTMEECEDRLFKWYRELGGELERGEMDEIIWTPVTNHRRYCVKIEINKSDLK